MRFVLAHDRDILFIHYSLNYIFLQKKIISFLQKKKVGGWGEGQVRDKLGKTLLPCRMLSSFDPYLTLVLPSAMSPQPMAKTSKMLPGAGLCVCVCVKGREGDHFRHRLFISGLILLHIEIKWNSIQMCH